jgi:hypothetical protein
VVRLFLDMSRRLEVVDSWCLKGVDSAARRFSAGAAGPRHATRISGGWGRYGYQGPPTNLPSLPG